jgi:hypothetical protein
MRTVLLLAVHLGVTLAKLVRLGGVRAVMAEMRVLKHQIMFGNRSFDDCRWEAHCRGLFELPVAV